jgi:hypothetical protein
MAVAGNPIFLHMGERVLLARSCSFGKYEWVAVPPPLNIITIHQALPHLLHIFLGNTRSGIKIYHCKEYWFLLISQ